MTTWLQGIRSGRVWMLMLLLGGTLLAGRMLANPNTSKTDQPKKSAATKATTAGESESPTSQPAAPSTTKKEKKTPQLSVYRWGAPKGPGQVDKFSEWVGQPLVWGEDFQATDTWNNISDPGWQLWPWGQWVKAAPDRRLILSVPMLPGAWNRSGPGKGTDAGKAVSLKDGAAGKYNHHFETLAKKLVEQGLDQTILRIGWEFNGGWYVWRASDDVNAWTEYFRQIVKTMRSVKGAQFTIVWNPATDYLQFPAENAYPGDKYVDIIGVDVYDQSWMKGTYPFPKDATEEQKLAIQKKAWNDWTYWGNHGLAFWAKFAEKRDKPMAICEWGVCDRQDGHGGMIIRTSSSRCTNSS